MMTKIGMTSETDDQICSNIINRLSLFLYWRFTTSLESKSMFIDEILTGKHADCDMMFI